ncbi:MAG: alpha/beta hydrolase [Chlorobiaceae bacterium]|nr:alpha/beta hydrolase [Chlorobiaceae bacterium]NTW74959.1 alpha/beta hydrolase [Chlorobiaceae bacterium]
MAPQDNYIVIGGHRHRYIDSGGEGPPMLLVHGISSSLDFYGPSIPLLARSFRLLALDLLGFGSSDKPKGAPYSLSLYAELIREFAEKTGAAGNGPLYATGHSMGGKYLLATALIHQGLFDKLVLSNTDGFISLPSWARVLSLPGVRHILKPIVTRPRVAEKMLSAAFHSTDNIPPETLKKILEDAMDRDAFETVMGLNRNLLNLDMQRTGLRSRLDELRIPTLIIWGDHDRYMSPKIARIVEREIPCSKLIIIENCGHSPMIEHPQEFSSAITEFILNEPEHHISPCS